MKKIIFLADSFENEHIASFCKDLGPDFVVHEFDRSKSLMAQVEDADFIISYNQNLTSDILSKAQRLKMVVRLGTARGFLDEDWLNENNIAYYLTTSIGLISVAEHSFMLILALAKELRYSDYGVRAGLNPLAYEEKVTDQRQFAYNWLNLQHFDAIFHKTLGIVGFGVVGKRVAQYAKAFDMDVIYNSGHRLPAEQEKLLGVRWGTLDQVLCESDFVSAHVKVNETTKGMFNKKTFAKMKPTAYFINTSRGAIVNEEDLCEALTNGVIAGAGLDVFNIEPLPHTSPLTKMDNVILSAHSAGIQLHRILFHEFSDAARQIKCF